MREESISINTSQSIEDVIKEVEDCLTRVGQITITKKGLVSLTPKAKYSGFFSAAQEIEGTIRKGHDDEYGVTLTYRVKPTMKCWVVGLGGVLIYGATLWLFLIPYKWSANVLRNDIRLALQQARQELEN